MKKPVDAADATTSEMAKAPADKQAPTQAPPVDEPKPSIAKAKPPAAEEPAPKPVAATPAPAVLAHPELAKPGAVTYRVWPHGTLQRNGKTHQPGDTLTLPPAEGDVIVCLERV